MTGHFRRIIYKNSWTNRLLAVFYKTRRNVHIGKIAYRCEKQDVSKICYIHSTNQQQQQQQQQQMDYKQEGKFWIFMLGIFLLDYKEQMILVTGYYPSALS